MSTTCLMTRNSAFSMTFIGRRIWFFLTVCMHHLIWRSIPAECYTEFRVEKWHTPWLADRLQIPPTFQCPQGSVHDGMEGLCILLKQPAYPCRDSDMDKFARPVPVLSMITNTVLEYIYDRHGHTLAQWNNQVMDPNHLQKYADAISA